MPDLEPGVSRAPLGSQIEIGPDATAGEARPAAGRGPARARAGWKWAGGKWAGGKWAGGKWAGRRALCDGSGQTIIEMAVALPSFLLLLLGIFNFSMVMFDYENATFACRVGARYASVNSASSRSPCTATSVKAMIQPYLWTPANSTTVSVSWPNGNSVGSTVSVSITVVFPLAIPFFSGTSVTVGTSEQRTIVR
jgi:Flp pilus assembly protein TadG